MPTAAERGILEYLIETGFIDDRLVKLAEQVRAGYPALSNHEEVAFQAGVAEKWFQMECEECNSPMAIEDIPVAIELGDALCPRCRRPEQPGRSHRRAHESSRADPGRSPSRSAATSADLD